MINCVFDLDGTLADTHPIVLEAYKEAGVWLSDDDWGKPAHEWLPQLVGDDEAREIHARKNRIYRALISVRGVRRLPAATLCDQLRADRHAIGVLTGASLDAARLVKNSINLGHVPLLGAGADTDTKISVLNSFKHPGVYFDDNLHVCDVISNVTSWRVIYVGKNDTVTTLRTKFEEASAQCTQ